MSACSHRKDSFELTLTPPQAIAPRLCLKVWNVFWTLGTWSCWGITSVTILSSSLSGSVAQGQPPGAHKTSDSDGPNSAQTSPKTRADTALGIGRIKPAEGSPHLSPFAARITRVHVSTGQTVRKGEALFTLTRLDPGNDFSSFTVRSNLTGTLTAVNGVEGGEVTGLSVLATVVPLNSYSGSFVISDRDLPHVSIGQSLTVRLLEPPKERASAGAAAEVASGAPADAHATADAGKGPEQVELKAQIAEISTEPQAGTGLFTVHFDLVPTLNPLNPRDLARGWAGQLVTLSLRNNGEAP